MTLIIWWAVTLSWVASTCLADGIATITAHSSNPTPPPSPESYVRYERQDTTTAPSTTSLAADTTTVTTTLSSHTPLAVSTTPVPLAATIGLIMPNPWQPLYVGLNYTFGFVDAVPRPAPTIGGWLRQVQPVLIFPNHTYAIFPGSGTADPDSPEARPDPESALCGSTAQEFPVNYPFVFQTPGWYMFVLNQTWSKPTITNNTCSNPLVYETYFFSTQTLSLAPIPKTAAPPVSPTTAYTVYAGVTTDLPGNIPVDPHTLSNGEKLGLGIGVAIAVLALGIIGLVIWWVRKKRKLEVEALPFSRLSTEDKASFLQENPNSWLNPANPQQRFLGLPIANTKGNQYATQPPAPPGTAAYADWYAKEYWRRQQGWAAWQAGQQGGGGAGVGQAGNMANARGFGIVPSGGGWGRWGSRKGVPNLPGSSRGRKWNDWGTFNRGKPLPPEPNQIRYAPQYQSVHQHQGYPQYQAVPLYQGMSHQPVPVYRT